MGLFHECVGEAIGTSFIVLLGCGAVASSSLKLYSSPPAASALTTSLFVNSCFGLGVGLGVISSYDVSSAHLNPAVTINAMVHGGFPKKKGLGYMVAQVLGALIGGCFIALNFFLLREVGARDYVFNAFCTAPHPSITWGNAFLNEMMATFVLVVCISVLTTSQDSFGKLGVGAALGFTVFAIGNVFGVLSGYAINPARDLGPRLVYFGLQGIFHPGSDHWAVVWGSGYGLFVPIVGPILGALLAGSFHRHFLSVQLPEPPKEEQQKGGEDAEADYAKVSLVEAQ